MFVVQAESPVKYNSPPPYHSLKKKSKNNNKNNNRKIPGKVISVRAMMNEYRQNSDKAKSRYENKTIFVQGKVTHISGGCVVLEDVLYCHGFSMGSERAMHLGQKVIIRGNLSGSFLYQCRLMS